MQFGYQVAVPRAMTPDTGHVTDAVDRSPTEPFSGVHSVSRTVPE
jgi:hypothetical protein